MTYLNRIVCFILFSVSVTVSAVSQEGFKESVTVTVNPYPKLKLWGIGFSLGANNSFGLQFLRKLDSSWKLQLAGATRYSNCCAGGNPTSEVPYGYSINEITKTSLSLVLSKSFPIDNTDKWSLFIGTGLGIIDTYSKAQFYNKAWIGYDLNSPAGSQSVQQRRIVVPGQFGFTRKDFKIFSFSTPMSVLIDVPLNGPGESPTYRTAGGQTVTADSSKFNDSSLMFQLDILF